MSEKQVRVEQEAHLLTRLEHLQMQFDSRFPSSQVEVFDKLHSHLQNLHTQVSGHPTFYFPSPLKPLQISHAFQLSSVKLELFERDHLLDNLQRHLLTLEVNRRLMTTQLRHRDVTIAHLGDQQRCGVVKRWKSFQGADFIFRKVRTLFKASLKLKAVTRESEEWLRNCLI